MKKILGHTIFMFIYILFVIGINKAFTFERPADYPEGLDYASVLGSEFLSMIQKPELGDKLLNLVVVVWAGRTSIYASYCDAIMVLPFAIKFCFSNHFLYLIT